MFEENPKKSLLIARKIIENNVQWKEDGHLEPQWHVRHISLLEDIIRAIETEQTKLQLAIETLKSIKCTENQYNSHKTLIEACLKDLGIE